MGARRNLAFFTILLVATSALGATTWQSPPEPIGRILDAPRPPALSFSPDDEWMIEISRPSLPPIAELAEEILKLAGTRINPRTNGPAREYAYTALNLRAFGKSAGRELKLPPNARIRNTAWSTNGKHFAFTLTQTSGIELWVVDLPNGEPRRLTGPVLNAAYGAPCTWLPGDEGLACRFIPAGRGKLPQESRVPLGPVVEESSGRLAAGRTYTNLLKDPHDEALFEYFFTSTVDHVDLSGKRTQLAGPAIVSSVSPSPDGRHVLLKSVHRPFSYHFPLSRFPQRVEVINRKGEAEHLVADLPLADDIPIKFGSVRKGPRSVSWRADRPATLTWVEALDGGDAGKPAEKRDGLHQLAAPFRTTPTTLWESELRFGGTQWGRADVALVSEWWRETRTTRTWLINPSDPSQAPRKLTDRNYQDAYSDPGSPEMTLGEHGRYVLRFTPDGSGIYLNGRGASPEGVHPFLDRMTLRDGKSERLWQSSDPYYERVVEILDEKAKKFVTRRESKTEPPNYFVRTRSGSRAKALTFFEDPAPELAELHKEIIRYQRKDGVDLSATLYLPPGYDKQRDGALPAVFWAYPREFKTKKSAGRVTAAENTFSRPRSSSILFMLTQGYAVVSGPTMPIIGEGDAEPNDTFIEQLVTSAEAAVDKVVSMGVVDRDRIAIGGHSYGAFTTAHLLAHSDLFQAGIARSGAYNRSLTPFGFQGEQRTYWEATQTYLTLSPFTHAAKIDEPMLMTHGADDSNSGTYPIQSERMYAAIKGLGGTVRWVVLPHEDHGYRSREAVGHVLWEMARWLDLHVKGDGPTASGGVGQ